uniref:Stabilin 1 n=1 Tax=Amphiprion ocellaris TaxID=80972 RepID=A0A3Q1AJG6_AMPOC
GDGEAASCECLPGYRRNNQNKCMFLSPGVCSQRDCDVNAQCSSQGSRISCVCKPDYEGDGRVCLPRNPCSDNNGGCPSNSTVCVFKGANKVSSGPNPGGTGPGSVSDPVLSDTCHSSATCRTELDGRPRCVCEASEIGDGRRCYGNLMERLMELDRSEKGCSLLLNHNGPFTAFVPLLKTPLTVRIPSFMFILMEEPSRFYSVVLRDLPAANGIIHIIDRPIRSSFDIVAPEGGNIKLNSESFNHSSVSLFLQNCGSPPPLKGPGPITVFVPTNQAIDRARDGSILFFMHLQLTVDDLSALPRIQTMANQMITIRVSDDGRILLGDKRVQLASTNIMASNGVIHMIDGLLFPPSILPILPHRCDVTESKITVGPCVHCSYLYETQCPHGTVEMDSHQVGCEYVTSPLRSLLSKGCAKFCNATKQVRGPSICPGFYGPDCKPCIGGFQHPCYDKGTCFDGIHGNGSCSCQPGLSGIACHICSDPNKHGERCNEECRCVHGVCDNRPGSGGVCRRGSCLVGFSGDLCDKTAMPCNSDGLQEHCHVHAYCTHTGLHTTCLCRDGYEGDGYSCSPINPCMKNNRGGCDSNAQCVFVRPGEASCACAEGWTGDGKVCVEINNCDLETRGGCSPNADCNHIGPGQSECVCKTGYMGNGIVCDLIDPCLKNNGGCHELATCQLKEGGTHTCTCPDGYAGDGNICYGNLLEVKTHLSSPGPAAAALVEETGGGVVFETFFFCLVSLFVSFCRLVSCFCRLVSVSVRIYQNRVSVRINQNRVSVRIYENRVSVRIYQTNPAPVCLQDHTCCPGFYGHECFKCPGDVGSWCSNHGECQDGNHGNGECRCYEGFHGTACEDCEPGRYGANCSSKCVCNHGKCEDGLAGSGRCVCYKGWRGASCSAGERDKCTHTCQYNTTYMQHTSNIHPSYIITCSVCPHLSELDLCSRSNGGCSKFAFCRSVSAGERTCSCMEGYTGDGVVCLEVDGCLVNNGGCHMSADCIRTGPNMVRTRLLLRNMSGGFHFDNGGCHRSARCEYMGQGQRNCTCRSGYIGDGLDCRGSTHTVSHMTSDITLSAPDPAPSCCVSVLQEIYRQPQFSFFRSMMMDSGMLPVLHTSIHQPFTMFWPTDRALEALPAERQRWLTSPDHQDQLAATIKAHIIRNSRLMNVGQPTSSSSYRSMHGSTIKYRCDRSLGAVLINDNEARVVERFLSFSEGLAYGIDQLLEPPGLGAFCDSIENKTTSGTTERCFNYRGRYGYGYRRSRWYTHHVDDDLDDTFNRRGCKRTCWFPSWVQKCCKNHYSRDCQVCPGGLEAPCGNHGTCDDGVLGSGSCTCFRGFRGKACELCIRGYYGPNCTACVCGEHGRCDDGVEGSGQCVCRPGWEGERLTCDFMVEVDPECRHCHPQADCEPGFGCRCKPGFQGNGTFCTPDLCSEYNGGCHLNADCNQTDLQVNCTCHSGYQGDGYSCEPINRCVEETNGGCSDFASCKFTGPNERECECLPGYVGNGVQCLQKVVPPVDRCLEANGGCAAVASCKDLHYHENTAGVFHLRSPEGKYKMNFSRAAASCQEEDATLATVQQLGDAQQLGMHLCVAGWLDGGKVGYPTRFPSVRCGDNHVGLVMYKDPVDQSNPYDAYCYRLRDVSCSCPAGYIGNGDFCHSVLTDVLAMYSNFSMFYKVRTSNI